VRGFLIRYERHLSSGALILGFIIDNLTLRRVDMAAENILIATYIGIVGLAIVLLNLGEARGEGTRLKRLHSVFLIVMQFAIGGLFSGFLVFYARSSSLIDSWPFLLVLAGQLIANELLKKHYVRLSLQLSVLYLVLFSYFIFLVPLGLKEIGDNVFIASGFLSLMVIGLFIFFLRLVVPGRVRDGGTFAVIGIIALYALINTLYFKNYIPPIPLVLKESGIYHTLKRTSDGTYQLGYERQTLRNITLRQPLVHAGTADRLYAFTPIYAPAEIKLDIFHRWEQKDEATGEWKTFTRIPLPISGGREGGFRTYSEKTGLSAGKWRVSVETADGRIIGRMRFLVAKGESKELSLLVR
jgi:hypothetical protein